MNLNSFLSEAASSFLLVGLLGAALGASGAFPTCAATVFFAAGGAVAGLIFVVDAGGFAAAGVLRVLSSILFIFIF